MNINPFIKNILGPAFVIIGLLFIVIGGKSLYEGFFSKGPGAQDARVRQTLAQSQEFKDYKEPSTGILFKYPKTWSAKAIQGGTSFSALDDVINVRVSVDDFSGDKEDITPASYRELTKKQIAGLEKEAGVKYITRDEGTTTVASIPAYQWTYSINIKKISISGAQVWLAKDKKVFVMTYTAPERLFDAFYPLFKRMVESISLP